MRLFQATVIGEFAVEEWLQIHSRQGGAKMNDAKQIL